MREDMFKVIVERPRWGSRHAPKSKLRYDKSPGRKRATGRRMVMEHSGYTKCLNENLAPLKRYLHKQVGRPWDKVYSEISQHLDTSSTVKQHVRDHLTDFILITVTHDRDGGIVAMSGAQHTAACHKQTEQDGGNCVLHIQTLQECASNSTIAPTRNELRGGEHILFSLGGEGRGGTRDDPADHHRFVSHLPPHQWHPPLRRPESQCSRLPP